MLYIEKGGDEQLQGELESYNPLIPKGREFVATMLIEIEDEIKRARILATLGHIESTITLTFAGESVAHLVDHLHQGEQHGQHQQIVGSKPLITSAGGELGPVRGRQQQRRALCYP